MWRSNGVLLLLSGYRCALDVQQIGSAMCFAIVAVQLLQCNVQCHMQLCLSVTFMSLSYMHCVSSPELHWSSSCSDLERVLRHCDYSVGLSENSKSGLLLVLVHNNNSASRQTAPVEASKANHCFSSWNQCNAMQCIVLIDCFKYGHVIFMFSLL